MRIAADDQAASAIVCLGRHRGPGALSQCCEREQISAELPTSVDLNMRLEGLMRLNLCS